MSSMTRTTKEPFRAAKDGLTVDGAKVAAGTMIAAGSVVEIPSVARFRSLVAAGVIAESVDEDADVPKRALAGDPAEAAARTLAQANFDAARRQAETARAEADAIKARTNADEESKAKAEKDAAAAEELAAEAKSALDALDAKPH